MLLLLLMVVMVLTVQFSLAYILFPVKPPLLRLFNGTKSIGEILWLVVVWCPRSGLGSVGDRESERLLQDGHSVWGGCGGSGAGYGGGMEVWPRGDCQQFPPVLYDRLRSLVESGYLSNGGWCKRNLWVGEGEGGAMP